MFSSCNHKSRETYDVKKSIDKIEGFDKCSAIVTDGTPAKIEKKIWIYKAS